MADQTVKHRDKRKNPSPQKHVQIVHHDAHKMAAAAAAASVATMPDCPQGAGDKLHDRPVNTSLAPVVHTNTSVTHAEDMSKVNASSHEGMKNASKNAPVMHTNTVVTHVEDTSKEKMSSQKDMKKGISKSTAKNSVKRKHNDLDKATGQKSFENVHKCAKLSTGQGNVVAHTDDVNDTAANQLATSSVTRKLSFGGKSSSSLSSRGVTTTINLEDLRLLSDELNALERDQPNCAKRRKSESRKTWSFLRSPNAGSFAARRSSSHRVKSLSPRRKNARSKVCPQNTEHAANVSSGKSGSVLAGNKQRASTSKQRKESVDDDGWEDVESDSSMKLPPECDVLGRALDEKSKSVHFTPRNVRSLLHSLITNEQVLDMVRNTLQEDGLGDQLKEAIFEPKMTRSKVKEVIENGNLRPSWILSPKKAAYKPASQFLEMTFSDNEDEDEEYQPAHEELEQADASDGESSCSTITLGAAASSPWQPSLSQESAVADEPDGQLESMMALLEAPLSPRSEFREPTAPPTNEPTSVSQSESAASIAQRTRSQLPLKDTSLDVIEAQFVAPDITPDMYETFFEDPDWDDFLKQLGNGRKDTGNLNDTMDDEVNDPEYNFLEEAEKEVVDVEDFRDDKTSHISKKELSGLMDELIQEACDHLDGAYDVTDYGALLPDLASETGQAHRALINPDSALAVMYASDLGKASAQPAATATKIASSADRDLLAEAQMGFMADSELEVAPPDVFSADELLQLRVQMRKHVQLLAQTYITCCDPKLANAKSQMSQYLKELRLLGDQHVSVTGQPSYYHPPNLDAAIELIGRDPAPVDRKRTERLNELAAPTFMHPNMFDRFGLTYEQMALCAETNVFMYPHLLPTCRLWLDSPFGKRVCFIPAEDNLLALGLVQFCHFPDKYTYIQRYLLPTKTTTQLRFRLKNLRSARTSHNVIKHLITEDELPEFERFTQLDDTIVPIEKRPLSEQPAWWNAFASVRQLYMAAQNADATTPSSISTKATLKGCRTAKKSVAKQQQQQQKVQQQKPQQQKLQQQQQQQQRVLSKTSVAPVVLIPVNPTPSPSLVLPQAALPSSQRSMSLIPMSAVGSVLNTQSMRPLSVSVVEPVFLQRVPSANTPVLVAQQATGSRESGVCSTSDAVRSKPTTTTTLVDRVDSVDNDAMPLDDHDMVGSTAQRVMPSTDQNCGKMARSETTATAKIVTTTAASTSQSDSVLVDKMAEQERPTASVQPRTYAKIGVSGLQNLVVWPKAPVQDRHSSQFTTRVFITQSGAVNATISPPRATILGTDHSSDLVQTTVQAVTAATTTAGEYISSVSQITPATSSDLLQQAVASLELPTPPPPSGESSEPLISLTPTQLRKLGVNVDMLTDTLSQEHSRGGDGVGVSAATSTQVAAVVQSNENSASGNEKVSSTISQTDSVMTTAISNTDKNDLNIAQRCTEIKNGVVTENMAVVLSENSGPSFAENASAVCTSTMPAQDVGYTATDVMATSDVTPNIERLSQDAVVANKSTSCDANSASDRVDSNNELPVSRVIEPAKMAVPVQSHVSLSREVPCHSSSSLLPPRTSEAALISNGSSHSGTDSLVTTVSSPSHNAIVPYKEADLSSKKVLNRNNDLVSATSLSQNAVLPHENAEFSTQDATLLEQGTATEPPPSPLVDTFSPDHDDGGHSTEDDMSSCGHSAVDSSLDETQRYESDSYDDSDCTTPLASTPEKSTVLPTSGRTPHLSPVVTKPRPVLPKPIDTATIHQMPSSPPKRPHRPQKPASGPRSPVQCKPRRLLPKSVYVSPVKAAAANVRRARIRLQRQAKTATATTTTTKRTRPRRILPASRPLESDVSSESDEDAEAGSHQNAAGGGGGGAGDVEEDVDEDDFAELFAASSTINFAQPKKTDDADANVPKLKGKKAALLDSLVPNLIESDPLCDERDTAFARTYLNKVKSVLQKDYRDIYESFMKLLYNFHRCQMTAVQLYEKLRKLLARWPALVRDFAGFLRPDQAEECGCFMENFEFRKARTFLRKLEVHFRKQPAALQRVLRVFTDWQNSAQARTLTTLKASIRPIIRAQPHLLDEFAWFFSDERVPTSYLTEFEEAVLPDNEDDLKNVDDMEEAQLPAGDDEYLGSQWCKCSCHASHRPDPAFTRRRPHCRTCAFTGVKTHRGRVYLQTADSQLKPVNIVFPTPPGERHKNCPDGGIDDIVKPPPEEIPVICTNHEETFSNDRVIRASDELPNTTQVDALAEDETPRSSQSPITPVDSSVIMTTADASSVDCPTDSLSQARPLCDTESQRPVESSDQTVCDGTSSVDKATGESEDIVWTRDEDQQLLEACKRFGPTESSFQSIADRLGNKTPLVVMQRFQHLMRLFSEQPSDTDRDSDLDETMESE